jgi:kanamycin kinase
MRFPVDLRSTRTGLLGPATMSLSWNYADFDERVFWDAYGLEPDGARIEYYRDLYRVT